ncbi:MAG: hypothetical protein LBV42_03990 [Methanobrevibacter sp.]|jgi:uncharacterized membrane protein|nr:hypothetical protein [Methanobrevibacter sp.]
MSKEVYKNKFLDEIIFHLKFQYALTDENKAKIFHEKIKSEFKYLQIKNKQFIDLKINNKKGEFKVINKHSVLFIS